MGNDHDQSAKYARLELGCYNVIKSLLLYRITTVCKPKLILKIVHLVVPEICFLAALRVLSSLDSDMGSYVHMFDRRKMQDQECIRTAVKEPPGHAVCVSATQRSPFHPSRKTTPWYHR